MADGTVVEKNPAAGPSPGVRTRLTSAAAAAWIRFVHRTSRVHTQPAGIDARVKANAPVIYAFWHGQFLMIPAVRPNIPTGVMVARHDDAEVLARTLEHFDLSLIRGGGAGTRAKDQGGAAALRAAVAALKAGTSVAMTADVPPGPARRAGAGIIALARLSGRPIVPAAVATSRFRVFDTWSRLTLNLPFSRLGVAMGEPLDVPRRAGAEDLEQLRGELEAGLNALTRRAYEIAGANDNPRAPLTGRPVPMGLGLRAYRLGTGLIGPFASAILRRRMRAGKEDPERLHERLGYPKKARPHGRLVWFHAASVGELNVARPLVETIAKRHPEFTILVTTGTVTSAKLAADRLSGIAIHQFIPLDGIPHVRRFLAHWQPDLAVFTESEIWPNLVYETAERGTPLVLVNARMSGSSARAWRKQARTAAALFTRFDRILAQSESDARAICRLGATAVYIAGNLKIDAPPLHVDASARDALIAAIAGRPVLVAASTHPGEEEILITAHRQAALTVPGLLTIIAPRHPHRGAAIAAIANEAGLTAPLRSAGDLPDSETDVYIADTLGELGILFAVAQIAFMGGSLIPHGGQNPVEPIRLGCPTITGTHHANFAQIYKALRSNNGVVVVPDGDSFVAELTGLLQDGERRRRLLANADEALRPLGGAFARTLDVLEAHLANKA